MRINRADVTWRTMLAAVAVLAIGAIAAAPAGAASLSAKAEAEAITYKRGSTSIKGTLTGDEGVSAAGRTVKLYERPFPYKRSKQVATTVTDAEGDYRFEDVRPEVNSTYKVAINDPDLVARSKARLIVVFAQGDISVRTTNDRRIVSSFTLEYSPKLRTKLANRKVLWYFNKVGTPRFTVADRSRSKLKRKGLLTGRSRFVAPPGEYRFRVTYCLDVPDKRDIGVGPPGAPRNCPSSFPAQASRSLRVAADATSAFAPEATASVPR